jgi:hypothetical protein
MAHASELPTVGLHIEHDDDDDDDDEFAIMDREHAEYTAVVLPRCVALETHDSASYHTTSVELIRWQYSTPFTKRHAQLLAAAASQVVLLSAAQHYQQASQLAGLLSKIKVLTHSLGESESIVD